MGRNVCPKKTSFIYPLRNQVKVSVKPPLTLRSLNGLQCDLEGLYHSFLFGRMCSISDRDLKNLLGLVILTPL